MTDSMTARTTAGELRDEKACLVPSRRSTTTRRRLSGRPRRRRDTSTSTNPEPAMAPPAGDHAGRRSGEQTGGPGQILIIGYGNFIGQRAAMH
jgi:hypothetical protein